jgi:flagellar basal-body rod modification protein FlgD
MTSPTYSLQSIVPTVPQALKSDELDENPEEDFIKLMVAQLQNQDPDKPLDGTALVTQVTQMNAAIAMQRISYLTSRDNAVNTAASLLGRSVSLQDPNTGAQIAGKVQSVDYSSDSPQLVVDGQPYPLTAVSRVDV